MGTRTDNIRDLEERASLTASLAQGQALAAEADRLRGSHRLSRVLRSFSFPPVLRN
jgi:hypothetical protein